jgi:hypothetical protein
MIPEKSIVYLAGPMTGIEEFNHTKFVEAAQVLRGGYDLAVHNPAKSFGGRKDLDYKAYMRHCVHMLLESQAAIFLPGWEDSNGATAEAYMAQALGLPRYALVHEHLIPITDKLPPASQRNP